MAYDQQLDIMNTERVRASELLAKP